MELIISEQNGWKKPITIEKAITRLGSAPTSDVKLVSPEIAPIHLQIYYLDETPNNCKIFNLGNPVRVKSGDQHFALASLATIEIQNGSEIELGPYRIQVILPLSATTLQDTLSIQASLRLPEATLLPGQVTTGWLTIKNTGVQSSCQVDIDLAGLPADCMQVDPAPLLYTGGQEDVRIQLFHRKLYPAAGFQNLTINVSACDSYPGEQVVINQGIYVSPVFEQSLEIFDDLSSDHPAQKTVEPATSVVRSVPQNMPPSERSLSQVATEKASLDDPILKAGLPDESQVADVLTAETDNHMELQEAVAGEVSAPLVTSAIQPPKLKVVRNPSDDFWEKE